jgi:hypothetical protein
VELTSKASELLDKSKYNNLDKFEKWVSEIMPRKKFEETSKNTSLDRFPMLLGTVAFMRFILRTNCFKDENIVKSSNEPII